MDEDLSLAKSIRQHLLNSAALSTMVDAWKVFADRPPQTAAAPMIVFTVISETAFDSLAGMIGTSQARVQVDCYGTTREQANQLRLLVQQQMSGTRTEVDSIYLRIGQDGGQNYGVDRPETGSDQYRFINSQDFHVTHNEAVF